MNYDDMREKDRPLMQEKGGNRTSETADVVRLIRKETPSLSMVRKEKRDKRKMER
jgi:hypothetical protein